MATKVVSIYVPSMFLGLSAALTLGNWYLRPERAVIWGTALLMIAGMTGALFVFRSAKDDAGWRRVRDIRSGVLCGAGILVIALGGKLLVRLGAISETDVTWRITMALLGVFLIFTGNGIPKALTPLSTIQCDAARVQALQRFGGWVWVLTGFILVFAWLALPLPVAQLMTSFLLPGAMLLLAIQWAKLLRSRRPAPTGE